MKTLSRIIAGVTPSATLAITSLAKKMVREGKDVVNFAAGEPDFDTPESIKQSAITAINNGKTKYTPATGISELKIEICRKLLHDNELQYTPENIVISCGAKHNLFNALQAICNKDDEIIIPFPYWVSYPEMVRLAKAKPVIITTKKEDGFKVNPADLATKITAKTKAIIINSPSNPSGTVYTKDELKKIGEIAVKNDLYIISDEIYEKLIYDNLKHVSIGSLGREIYERTITVNGVSKAYAMTGWRIGYMAASKEIAKLASTIQSHSTSNPCTISQYASLKALTLKKDDIDKMRDCFQDRRDYMLKLLDAIPKISYAVPHGAFYVFCDISETKMEAKIFAQKLLQDMHVAVIPGESFGSGRYIRLSFATDKKNIETGIERLGKWVKR